MAARQYEMLFKLGAQLDAKFNGTFSSAQNVLQATQKRLQELNREQGDINAYQKQQTAVDNTTKRLEMYKEQLANVQREKNEDGKASSELENRELALKRRIEETEQKLADQNSKLRQMGEDLSEAGVDVNDLTGESKRLSEQMEQLKKDEEKAAEEAENFGNSGAQAIEAVGAALVAAGIEKALQKIADAYMECVGVSMEFEATMSTVEALSGASASSMSDLSAKAKELGATTVFTANQSAEAMTYMGMAGWGASEMLDGMNGVMNLAAASGEDLAMVSDIVTDNLTAFGLKAKDTAHFSDVLAQAASNSNTSVAIMGETFKGSASIAGALGYSVEDVATAVGLMANSGIKGSVAGTALKNAFNGLLNGATLTAAAFGEVEYSAVNADGTIDSFSDTINELRGYFSQMTEAERVQNAQLIAGQRGYNGLLAILNSTEEDYISLKGSIENCTGAAQRMADIKLDNLKGDVTLLDSAADGLKMTLGGLWNEEMRGIVQMGSSIMTGINDFCEKNPAVVKSLMLLVAEVGLLVGGYTAFTAIKKVKNTLSTIGAALHIKEAAAVAAETGAEVANTAATQGATAAHTALNASMLGAAAAVVAVTVALTAIQEACKIASLETMELSTATEAQYNEVERLTEEYDKACEAYGETSEQARALKYDLDEANAAIQNGAFSVSELYSEIDSLHDSTAELLSSYSGVTEEIESQRESAHILAAKLTQVANSSDDAAKKEAKMKPIIEKLNELYPELGLTVENAAQKMEGLGAAIDRAADSASLQAKYEAAQQTYSDLIVKQQQLQEVAEKAEAAQAAAAKRYAEGTGSGNLFGALGSMITGTYDDLDADYNRASEEARKAHEDLAAVNDALADQMKVVEEYEATINGTGESITTTYNAVSIAIGQAKDEVETLMNAYNEAYKSAYDSVNGQYNLWTEAAETVPTSIDTINTALESQTKHWTEYNDNLEKLNSKTGSIKGLQDVIASFADGSEDSVKAIAGMANASDEELKTMVDNFQKQQKAEEEAAQSLAQFRVDVEGQMDGILDKMEESVKDMNMSGEAKEAAKETIQAYINEILRNTDGVSDAGAVLQAALTNALKTAGAYDDAADKNGNGQPDYVDYSYKGGDINDRMNVQGMSPALWAAYENAYATGTDSAAPGLALVGENGPELLMMHGGEQVINARETIEILRAYEKLQSNPEILRYAELERLIESGGNNIPQEISVMYDIPTMAAIREIEALNAYAAGTESAAPGLALVGENGPELMIMGGGEQVVSARETNALLSGGNNVQITISPQLTITGEVTEDTEAKMREWQDELVEIIKDTIEDINSDKMRSVYS